jgi:hypothetical protein
MDNNPGVYILIGNCCLAPILLVCIGWQAHIRYIRYGWRGFLPTRKGSRRE